MSQTENAQRGVLRAILSLHSAGIFTALLADLYESVEPVYVVLNSPIEEPLFGAPVEARPSPIGSYIQASRGRDRRREEFETALRRWAARFRLTCDLTESGECLPWALEFGRALCRGEQIDTSPSRVPGRMRPPGGWVQLDDPDPEKETFLAWLDRIKPALRVHYSAERKRQRTRPFPDPAKRNPDHYRWFVLQVCGGRSLSEIADMLRISLQEDAVRKGIKSVRMMLGVNRK